MKLLRLLLITSLVMIRQFSSAQVPAAGVCTIISDSGPCLSNNTIIPGVNDGTAAFCITSGIYVGVPDLIGTIFITALTNQTCPAGVGALAVNQTAITQDSTTTALAGNRVAAVIRITSPTPQLLFSDSAIEDCAKGFIQF